MADDYTADASTRGVVAVGGSVTGTIETTTDIDWIKMQLTAGSSYQIDVRGSSSGAGSLYNPRIHYIANSFGGAIGDSYNDNSNGSPDSQVFFSPRTTGTYYIVIGGAEDSIGTYTASVATTAVVTTPLIDIRTYYASPREYDSGSTAPYVFQASRTGNLAFSSTVTWSVTGNVNGSDFVGGVLPSGTLTLDPNVASKNIMIYVQGDNDFEPDEVFAVTLSNPINATLGTSTVTATILNDDPLPAASLAIAPPEPQKEGNSGSTPFIFQVTRSGDLNGTSTASWAVTGSGATPATAADFADGAMPSGTVTFDAGAAIQTIAVDVKGDTTFEPNKGFSVTLSNAGTTTLTTATASTIILNDDAAYSITPVSPSPPEGNSGSTDYTFQVTSNYKVSEGSTVTWAVTGSGANPADTADFADGVLPSGTVTFAAGAAAPQTITVKVAGDTTVEHDEGFTLTLTPPTGAGEPVTATGIITDDDAAYRITPVTPLSQFEGNSGNTPYTFQVTRTGDVSAASTVTWTVAGSGDNPATAADFVNGVLPNGTVTFAATEVTKTITVNVAGDTAFEPDEGFTLTLTPPGGGGQPWPVTAIIKNDDVAPSLAIAPPATSAKPEGDSGSTAYSFVVTRTGDSSGISTVKWAVTGSGTNSANAADFVNGVLPNDTVTFAVGETTKTITVNVQGDTTVEPDEGFTVTLSNPGNATLATTTAFATITNDDKAYSITPLDPLSQVEGSSDSITHYRFKVTNNTSDLTPIGWSVGGYGSHPTDASDFTGPTIGAITYTLLSGNEQTVDIQVQGDLVKEPNEQFEVAFSLPTWSGQASPSFICTILDDDAPPLAIAASTPAMKPEGNSGSTPYTFQVTRTGDVSGISTADWTVAGSGTNPANATDFVNGVLPNGTVTFAAGETTKTITVNVAGDTTFEQDEGFTVTLSNPGNATLATATASATITNDDVAPSLAIAPSATPTQAEGNSGSTAFTFTVTRSGDSSSSSTANWTVAGSGDNPANAADFVNGVLPNGTVTFAAGETTKTITVNVAGDTTFEQNEGFTVTLSNPGNATLATTTASATITNDDVDVAEVFSTRDQSVTAVASGKKIYGNSGTEVLTIASGVSNITFDQNIERLTLNGPFAGYSFLQTGNLINIYDATGTTLVAKGPVQNDADGTLIAFSNGTKSAIMPTSGTGAMQLGGVVVATPTAVNQVSANVQTVRDKLILNSMAAWSVPVGAAVDMIGNESAQTVKVPDGASAGLQLGGGNDRVELAGNIADYALSTNGTSLVLTRGSSTVSFSTNATDDDRIVFADGFAVAKIIAGRGVTLGEISVKSNAAENTGLTASILNLTDHSGIASSTGTQTVRDKLILNSMAAWSVPVGAAVDMIGNESAQTVKVPDGASAALQLGGGNDRVELAGNIADYALSTNGTSIVLTRGSSRVSFSTNATDDDRIVFADGFAVAKIIAGSGVTLGGISVKSNAAENTGLTASILTATDHSSFTSTDIIFASSGTSVSAADQDYSFSFLANPGIYAYTITGFGAGDKILFPSANLPTVSNTSFTDGFVDLSYAADGQVVTIRVTGIDHLANEIALSSISGWNTLFGAGTIL